MKNARLPFLPAATPPAWLGVMGGGQLGRMFAHAAQTMGFKVVVLEPSAECPAGQAADHLLQAAYDDTEALAVMAARCLAVTTEFENVPAQSLAALAPTCFVAPAAAAISVAQDRVAEKRFFSACAEYSQVMPAPWRLIETNADLAALPDDLFPGILKTVRMGYDGKGQARVKQRSEAGAAFAAVGQVPCVLERMLDLEYEISVLAARAPDGACVVYPIAENVHRDGILFTTTAPSPNISPECGARAQHAAREIIARLDYVGVLCIEFFVLRDGSLVVNEMAPRPHNSGHYTIDACVTSQFGQQVRAMAGLPLGEVRQHSPAIMLNLLGDLWFEGAGQRLREPPWDQVLALPGANLHLYGKEQPRRGRKMGHVTFVTASAEQAHASFTQACAILGIAV